MAEARDFKAGPSKPGRKTPEHLKDDKKIPVWAIALVASTLVVIIIAIIVLTDPERGEGPEE